MIKLSVPALLCLLPLAASPGAQEERTKGQDRDVQDANGKPFARIRETVIGFNDPGMQEESFVASPDGSRVAYMVMDGAGIAIVVDGKKGESFEGFGEGSLVFSPDGRHYGYVGTRPSKQVVVYDGKLHEYEGIGKQGIVFNSDGSRVAWVAERDEHSLAVIDGLEGPPFDAVSPEGVLFSPDGKRSAYLARSGEKSLVVIDGEEGRLFDAIAGLRFTSGGQHTLYVGLLEDKYYAVVDGREFGPFEELRSTSSSDMPSAEDRLVAFVESAQGTRVAFAGRRADGWYVFVDGQEKGPFQNCAGLAFSPEGSRVVFLALRDTSWFMSIDGVEQPARNVESLSFSPDGKRLASVLKKGEKRYARIDDQDGPEYDKIEAPGVLYSHDGKRTAYLAVEGAERFAVLDGAVAGPRFKRAGRVPLSFAPNSSRLMYSYRRGEKEVLVIDGREGPPVVSFRTLEFSPDAARYAYAAELEKDRWVVVVDGSVYGPGGVWKDGRGKAYPKLGRRTPSISPDGTRVAWVGVSEEGWKVVVDGVEGPAHEIVQRSALEFSPDGRHVAYVAQHEGKKMLFVDGVPLENSWDGFRAQDSIFWLDSQRFTIRASRNPRYLLVEVTLL